MSVSLPSPGHGFSIRETLGGGNWKTAYRASSLHSLADVALLYFHDDTDIGTLAAELPNLLVGASEHEYSDYLAEFKGINRDKDGRFFIVEELLVRPLDHISPVKDLGQFVKISRDLCRGLTCLHDQELVHRDLKLDNFGLDNQQRAKIFDLGTVTSEGADIRGTILTRAPELFTQENDDSASPKCDRRSDVWALGASLFALRSGAYPFVHEAEVSARKKINTKALAGELTEQEARREKEKLDLEIADRILRPDAFEKLQARVHSILRGRPEELLISMLQFDPALRKDILWYATEWGKISNELARPSAAVGGKPEKWDLLLHLLETVARDELVLTEKQLNKIVSDIDSAKQKDEDISQLEAIEGVIKTIRS